MTGKILIFVLARNVLQEDCVVKSVASKPFLKRKHRNDEFLNVDFLVKSLAVMDIDASRFAFMDDERIDRYLISFCIHDGAGDGD